MGRWESRYIQDDINIILIKSQSHIKQTTSYKSATTKKDGVLGCGLAWEALVCCRHRKLAALTHRWIQENRFTIVWCLWCWRYSIQRSVKDVCKHKTKSWAHWLEPSTDLTIFKNLIKSSTMALWRFCFDHWKYGLVLSLSTCGR